MLEKSIGVGIGETTAVHKSIVNASCRIDCGGHTAAAVENIVLGRSMASVEDGHVQEVLRSAHEELLGLIKLRTEIVKRITTVKSTVEGLASMFGAAVLNEDLTHLVKGKPSSRRSGLTNACRSVLRDAETPLRARDICHRIQKTIDPMLSQHKQPLASVTTVLNRLVHYGEVRSLVDAEGRRTWQWIPNPHSERDSSEEA